MVKRIGSGTKRPYINFIGGSSTDVTGSCHQVRFRDYNLLLDCGLIQTNNIVVGYQANKDLVKKIKPKEIRYIIISHLHCDHTGLLAPLFAKGCQAHIYIPAGSLTLLRIMMEDSIKIMQQDADKLARKHGIKASPLATPDDIDKVLDRCIEVEYNRPTKIADGMEFTYYSAGHIIYSAQVLLELHEGSVVKRIGYSGDVGSLDWRVSVEPRQNLPFCDVLIGESTYCQEGRQYSIKKDRYFDRQMMKTAISQYQKILIPVFSLQRTEDILAELYLILNTPDMIPYPTIYLDSPLACRIFNNWDIGANNLRDWGKLKLIDSWPESQALQASNEHCIILASSGMLTAGRALSHVKSILPSPNNCVLFCGWSGDNTLATEIKHGSKEIKVDGEFVSNKAQIYCLNTFSSHANYSQLMEYYEGLRFNKLALVHGQFEDKVKFSHTLQDKLTTQGISARVVAVNADQKIFL